MMHFSKIKLSFLSLLFIFLFSFEAHAQVAISSFNLNFSKSECVGIGGRCELNIGENATCSEEILTPIGKCLDTPNLQVCCKTMLSAVVGGDAGDVIIDDTQGFVTFYNRWRGGEYEGKTANNGAKIAPLLPVAEREIRNAPANKIQAEAIAERNASAQSGNGSFSYTLLEKIPGIDATKLSFAAYLSAIYKLAIWIVGLSALFMFLIGAFMYMLSAANTSKMGSAKSIMQDALIGLVLALASYLILYVINPDLVNLKLPSVSMSAGAPGSTTTPSASKTPGATWPDDSSIRKDLDNAGISFNKSNCITEGDKSTPCTSVAELGSAGVNGLKSLKTACAACHDSKSDVMVNGGTEYWFHGEKTAHQKGNSVVDLNRTPDLLAYLQQSGQVACMRGGRPVYRVNGADYWDEDANHFHANFAGPICK